MQAKKGLTKFVATFPLNQTAEEQKKLHIYSVCEHTYTVPGNSTLYWLFYQQFNNWTFFIYPPMKCTVFSQGGWRRSPQEARRAAVRQPRVRSSARAPQNMK